MRPVTLLAVLTCFALGPPIAAAQHSPWKSLDTVSMTTEESLTIAPMVRGQNSWLSRFGNGRMYFTMDYLLWEAKRDATPFAGTLSRPSGTIHGLPIDPDPSLTSHMHHAVYDHDSGFRFNFGYKMNDSWNLGFRYTYFHTNGTTELGDPTVDSKSVLANRLDRSLADDILDAAFDDGEADYASQHISLDFDTYDLELRRQLRFPSQRLAVNVSGGLRFATINQTSQISYQNFDGGNLLTANTDEVMKMNAAGLRVGAEAHYLLGWNVSLFARGAVSLMYGNINVSRQDVQLSATQAGIRTISDGFHTTIPVTELNVGLRWQRGRFFMATGYDMATWFDMVQGIDAIYQDDVDGTTNGYRIERGNLSLNGFFAEAGILF